MPFTPEVLAALEGIEEPDILAVPPPGVKRKFSTFVPFGSEAERDEWIASIHERDEIVMGVGLRAQTEEQPDAVALAEIEITLDAETVELVRFDALHIDSIDGAVVKAHHVGKR